VLFRRRGARSLIPASFLFPVDASARTPCDMYNFGEILGIRRLWRRPRLIISTMGKARSFFPHAATKSVRALSHDVTGNIDATRSLDALRQRSRVDRRRRHADLVVACRYVPTFTRGRLNCARHLTAEPGKILRRTYQELLMTKQAPEWLKTGAVRNPSNFVIYEVGQNQRRKKTSKPSELF